MKSAPALKHNPTECVTHSQLAPNVTMQVHVRKKWLYNQAYVAALEIQLGLAESIW